MILITSLLVFSEYIFGKRLLVFMDNDIGSDTAQQYIQQFSLLIRRIRTGNFSAWDATNGFGVNIFTYNLTNPVLLLLYGIGAAVGAPRFLYALVYLYILEILLAGIAGYGFLSEFPLSEKSKLIASYMFAFNGHILVWGQHYQFAIYSTLAALMLLCAEKCVKNPAKWPWMTAMTFAAVFTSAYGGYMIILFTAVYVILRLIMTEPFRIGRFFLRGIRIALPMLLGIAMAAVTILPFAVMLREVSIRLTTNRPLLQRLFGSRFEIAYYKMLYGRMFSSAGYGVSSEMRYLNYYEAPCAYFTLLFVPLAAQYAFTIPTMKTTRKNKILQYVIIALALLAIGTTTVPVIMNGFTMPTMRFYYQYMVYFSLVSAVMLDRIFLEKKGSILLYLLVEALILYRMFMFTIGVWANPYRIMPVIAAMSLVMTASLIFLRKAEGEKTRKRASYALIFSLMAMVAAEGFGTFDAEFIVSNVPPISSRGALIKGGKYEQEMYDPTLLAALTWIGETDEEYYRIEKMQYTTYGTDAMAQDYRGVSSYNSTLSGALQKYVDQCWPSLRYWDGNHYYFPNGADNTEEAALCGIRYLLAIDPASPPEGYEEIRVFGNIHVFCREDVKSIAAFYPEGHYKKKEGSAGTEAFVWFEDRDTESRVNTHRESRDDRFTAEVEASSDGLLYVAIPCEIGWKAYVDGEETGIIPADYAFCGIPLRAGTHRVELRYTCPGLLAGALISGAALLAFAVLLFFHSKRQRKEQ